MSPILAYVGWVLAPIFRRINNGCWQQWYSLIAITFLANSFGSVATAQSLDFIRLTIANCVAAVEAEPSIETRLSDMGWTETKATDVDDGSLAGYRLSHFPEEMFGVAWGWRTEPARIGRNIVSGTQLKQAWEVSNSVLSDLRNESSATGADEAIFILQHSATKSVLVLEIYRTADVKRGKCSFAATRELVGATFDKLLTTTNYPINYLELTPMDTDPGRFRFLRGVSVKQDLFVQQIKQPFPFVVVYWTVNELRLER